MKIENFAKAVVITVDNPTKQYLVLKDTENSEELIGKPRKVILGNDGIIPRFEEREV